MKNVVIGQAILEQHVSEPLVLKRMIRIPALATCLSLGLVFGLSEGVHENLAVAAYVSFDINPSIEASIDDQMRILSIKPLNNDAKAILEPTIQYRNMTLKAFTSVVIDKLRDHGYLKSQPELFVTTAVTKYVKQENREHFLKKVTATVEEFKSKPAFQNGSGSFQVVNTTIGKHNEAKKVGLSTGKYLIFLKASEHQKNLTTNQAKDLSVKEMRQYVTSESRVNNGVNHQPDEDNNQQKNVKPKQQNAPVLKDQNDREIKDRDVADQHLSHEAEGKPRKKLNVKTYKQPSSKKNSHSDQRTHNNDHKGKNFSKPDKEKRNNDQKEPHTEKKKQTHPSENGLFDGHHEKHQTHSDKKKGGKEKEGKRAS